MHSKRICWSTKISTRNIKSCCTKYSYFFS